jgi:chemotaxis-related protein WspB
MLYLLFELGNDRYALDVRQVVEVLPQVDSRSLPGAMPGMAGLFNYRGSAVPLLDLAQLSLGRPCPMRMSTRIIVTTCGGDESGGSHLIGLLAERVTETIRRNESDFKDVAVGGYGSKFSGPVLTEGNTMIQWVNIKDLLPKDLQTKTQLFAEVAGHDL